MKKIILSFVLIVCFFAAYVPVKATATEGKAIQLGTEHLKENLNTGDAATIYYGKDSNGNSYGYRVIGYDTDSNGVSNISGIMMLLANKNDSNVWVPSDYENSLLKEQMDKISNNLTTQEQAAILKRTLEGGSGDTQNVDKISGGTVKDTLLWPLSKEEAEKLSSNLRNISADWFLRSYEAVPVTSAPFRKVIHYVDTSGVIGSVAPASGNAFGVRPAFYLHLDSILFTSAAGAKGEDTSGILNPVSGYTDNHWKLTLLDSNHSSFGVFETEKNAHAGEVINVSYIGAKTGENEYISAMLCDKNGTVLYYGKIAASSERGTASFRVPDALSTGDYTLKLFCEQCNDGYKTDYSSDFQDINLHIIPKQEEITNEPSTEEKKTIPMRSLQISGISKKIAAGKKIQLFADVFPENTTKKEVIWSSSNKKVATVSSTGIVKLKKKSGGKSVIITATAADGSGVRASYKIKAMKGVVKKVSIAGKKTIKAGKALKLKAKVIATKNANKKVQWTSNNTNYATVSASGKVKTFKAGKGKKVKITAMATDGSNKKKTVTIKIK